jgi:probable rRNA maturation factor
VSRRRTLLRLARRTAARLRLGDVTLRLDGDAALRELERVHFGRDATTDVLSFPDGAPAPARPGGDIALNLEAVARQAVPSAGDPLLEEASRLVLHALAHLAGHDHGTRVEARRMLRCERRLLRRVGTADVPRPYDERGRAR